MDVEIRDGDTFRAWTGSRYDTPTRFPARIKAAASALFAEGLRGSFRIAFTPVLADSSDILGPDSAAAVRGFSRALPMQFNKKFGAKSSDFK